MVVGARQPALELGEAPFEHLEPAPDLPGRLLAPAGQPDPRLLPAPGKLVAGVATALDDLIDQVAGAIAGGRRGPGRGAHGALDRGAERVGYTAVALIGTRIPALLVGLAHSASQHNPESLTAYLRPTAPIAPTVLLPADPGLAMALATALTDKPLMANHHHGLWGYTGRTEGGGELTVQASGIGAPSAVAVLRELQAHGTRRVVRIGRAAPLAETPPEGAVVVVAALAADGASRALGMDIARPDAELTARLEAATTAPAAMVASHDLGHRAPASDRERWRARERSPSTSRRQRCSRSGPGRGLRSAR